MALLRRDTRVQTIGKRKRTRALSRVPWARIRNVVLVVVGIMLLIWGVQYSRVRADRKQALMEILRLQEAVRKFRWDHERCPYDLEELKNPPAGGQPYYRRTLEDPWGRPYHMVCPGRTFEDSADVQSAGPDGDLDTADDVRPH